MSTPRNSFLESLNEYIENIVESWDVELKAAQGQNGRGSLPSDFWPTYSAFANSKGGFIVLGIEEAGDQRRVLGLQEIDRVEQDIWNQLNNRQKVSANLLIQSNVVRKSHDGREVLVIKVPRADRQQRPVYINNNPMTGTYRRLNEGDHRCSETEINRMFADANVTHTRDAQILPHFSIGDLDSDSIVTYRNLLRSHNPNHPFLQSSDQQLLTQVKVFGTNRETGQTGISVAGLLMLGKNEAIRDHYPHYFVEYREIADGRARSEAESRWVDRVTADGTWAGNLLTFYLRVLPKLTATVKVPYQTNEALLRTGGTPVHTALKEGLVNCIVHADHGASGSVRIFKYVDRFEFFNPGVLLVDPDALQEGGRSESRNPILQDMFRYVGIGERAGSGVTAIITAWQEQHWRAPSLEDDVERGETHLVLPMVNLFPDEIVQQLQTRFGTAFQELEETERLAVCLAAGLEGGVTNRQVQRFSGQHGRDITYMLKGLVERGFLMPYGEKQGRKYSVTASSDETPQMAPLSRSEQIAIGSEHSRSSSQQTRPQVATFADQVRTKRKAAAPLVRAAIVELCTTEPQTISMLSEALARKSDTLRVHYISAMVEEGLLVQVYPETPNHPQQAYRKGPR